jgi:uroporphyrinogen III methyltransferase/synthase
LAGDSAMPLAGKRIVVTRAPEQAGEFIKQLRALGAEVLLLPTVRFEEPEDSVPLERAIRELATFDWLIFTSPNAVQFFNRRFAQLDMTADQRQLLLAHPRVAVVGLATGETALEVGFSVDYQAQTFRGESLAAELGPQVAGKRVLLPRSNLANPAMLMMLRAAGATVVEVVAYRTLAPSTFDAAVMAALQRGEVDVVTLFSPSALRHLIDEIGLETLRRHSGKMALAAIGPVTSEAARRAGLAVAIEAPEATAMSLAAAIAAHFPTSKQFEVRSS